jgi:hypothetical protein
MKPKPRQTPTRSKTKGAKPVRSAPDLIGRMLASGEFLAQFQKALDGLSHALDRATERYLAAVELSALCAARTQSGWSETETRYMDEVIHNRAMAMSITILFPPEAATDPHDPEPGDLNS